MQEILFWVSFFGAPLLLLSVTAFVFRPSAYKRYQDAAESIFTEDDLGRR